MRRSPFLPLVFWVVLACATLPAATWSGHLVIVQEVILPRAEPAEVTLYDEMIATWQDRLERTRSRLEADDLVGDEKAVLLADIAAYQHAILATRRRRGGRVVIDRMTYELAAVPIRQTDIHTSDAVMTVSGRSGTARVDRPAGNVLARDLWEEGTSEHRLGEPPVSDGPRERVDPIQGHPAWFRRMQVNDVAVRVFWTDELPNIYAVGLTVDDPPSGLNHQLAGLPGLPMLVEWTAADRNARYRIRVAEIRPEE